MKLAILGATGAVGRAVLEALEERGGEELELRLLASERSAGAELDFRGDPLAVEKAADFPFRELDAAIFAAPADVARAFLPRAKAGGCPVVDLSSAFRVEPDVPLAVAGFNDEGLRPAARGVVACPGATALHLAVALAPLHAAAGLERVQVTALQCASAAGRAGEAQLEAEARALMNGMEPEGAHSAFPHRLAFNLLPAAGAFGPSGYGEEELRISAETRRLLGALELPLSATVVRAPLFHGHLASVSLRTRRKLPAAEARELLRKAPGVKVLDAPGEGVYPMPMLAVADDAVHVGRIRDSIAEPQGLELLVVGDNLRTGAAANAVRLAERLARR